MIYGSWDRLLTDADALMDQAHAVLSNKGADYADSADALAGFRRIADDTGLSMRQVWGVFFGKHLSAVQAYVRHGKLESEPLRSRIIDAINYLILLNAIHEEDSGTAA